MLGLLSLTMPQPDTRRVPGPEASKDYKAYVQKAKTIIKRNGGKSSKRKDGRESLDTHRSLCKLSKDKPALTHQILKPPERESLPET